MKRALVRMEPLENPFRHDGSILSSRCTQVNSEEGTEGYNESDVHMDFVIPRSGLTVTAFNRRDDFQKGQNGKRLIDEGRWNFLE